MSDDERGALFSRVLTWLEHQQWELDIDEESDTETGRAMLTPSDSAAPWPVIVVVNEPDAQVIFYSLLPDEVPTRHREDIAELVTAINFGLTVGTVEIDMNDGDLRIRTGAEFGAATLDDPTLAELLGRLLAANLQLGATYFERITAVASGASTPSEFLAGAESD